MSENLKYLKKEDLNKLDNFIQESLDKYYYVKAWDQLYNNTGKNHKDIISDKSTIPDLVIYNKGFNKLNCFYYPNMKKKKVTFPRKLFILKPKKLKEYNPASSIINLNSKAQKEPKEEKKEEAFEFKSIPKEIENKFIGNNKPEENKLLSELNDFMKSDKDDKPKVEIIKEEEKNDNRNKNKNNNNNYNIQKNQKNKFDIYNMNNYNDYFLKQFQNMQYQKLNNQQMRDINKLNNNNLNVATNLINKKPEIKPISEINNNNNTNINVKNNMTSPMKYYSKEGDDENNEIQSYMQNMEEFMRNNMVERIWIVFNEKNRLVRKYNNEELYYLLNIILKTDEIKNNSIYFYKFPDVFVPPQDIFDTLKKIFQKK